MPERKQENLQNIQDDLEGQELSYLQDWQLGVQPVVCPNCDWAYLIPSELSINQCPHCFQAQLNPISEGTSELTYIYPPEKILPFEVDLNRIRSKLGTFSKGVWFAPSDLKAASLAARLQKVFYPVWLVDVGVKGAWQAEVGYDYEVVSHRERYSDRQGGWVSQEVEETRIRWEPRVGKISRKYENIPAPAIEDEIELRKRLGTYDSNSAQTFQPGLLKDSSVRLPNRSPEDAWPAAVPGVLSAASEECRIAASADHIRQFQWTPEYDQEQWTLMLLPMYTSYYLDDENKPRRVFINAQTGNLSGTRLSSMKRARRTSLVILAIAGVVFGFSALLSAVSLLLPVLLVSGGIGFVLAVFIALLAVIPVGLAWYFNRFSQA